MKFKKMLKNIMMGCINVIAMMMIVQTANSTCIWIVHQPEFPLKGERFENI